MTTQHTPGPWESNLVQVNGTNAMTYQIEGNALDVATRRVAVLIRGDMSPNGHCTYSAAEEEANARLIAAAPELLDALRNACNHFYALRDHAIESGLQGTVEQQAINEIIAAITKATA